LFILQLSLLSLKKENKEITTRNLVVKDYTDEFFGLLPFNPTNAQKRAVKEAVEDMQKGKQMNRLLQGDVGSGKTAVAASIVYTSAKNGMQSALMAPTEVLATQHFETFVKLFEGTGIRCGLLVGSTKAKDKNYGIKFFQGSKFQVSSRSKALLL
jgi:ATP-dependent DNA helicase RecG